METFAAVGGNLRGSPNDFVLALRISVNASPVFASLPLARETEGSYSSGLRSSTTRFCLVVGAALGATAWGQTGRFRGNGLHRRKIVAAATGTKGNTAEDVGVVFLSAGVGKRMGVGMPKQYLKLLGLEIALHSLDTFLACDVKEIVIVCAKQYRHIFEDFLSSREPVRQIIKYADGGDERQDSVRNGLGQLTTAFAAVHDAARPLVTQVEIEKVIRDARMHGAALLGVKTKATIKQASADTIDEPLVDCTPSRDLMWEAHTPQVIRRDMLSRGFEHAVANNLNVTDDVSLVEFLGQPVKLTEGEYTNMKVTTPEDMAVAESILRSRGFQERLS